MMSSFFRTPQDATVGPKPDPPAPLANTWDVRAAAGEPVAVVRVRNLASAIPVGRDAWGRANKLQPVLLSSEVSFARAFGTASARDEVNAETVHYGSLSKTLLGSLELWGQNRTAQQTQATGVTAKADAAADAPRTADVFQLLWVRITGRTVDGSRVALPPDQVPFLDAARLRSLALSIHLPKASLLGAGVSLATTACFKPQPEAGQNPLRSYARTLRLHGLHVPTLVGVNDNERKAKQMLVADVEIERFDVEEDVHSELERLVVETMEGSSFETLEALGTTIANKILHDFRTGDKPTTMKERGWQVKVCLEKPIAVPFAECPAVEVRMGQ
ncbi:Dihydroneopterin aldolase-domain-containing protein [Xylariomycetidae sp. FL0641]|nr:Dihydroneopterin aldolase-domain-containing protein [Xylariomycetidae sp. FL0641]